jgi:hypothetical protein
MAAFMSSNFTAPDRRKKVVTYGKASRLAPKPPPTTSTDAPSPELPHKHTTVPDAVSKRSERGLKTANSSRNTRANSESLDIFDVPSDNDFGAPAIKPTKTIASQHHAFAEKRRAPLMGGRPMHSGSQLGNAARIERGATKASLAARAPPSKAQKPVQPPKVAPQSQSTAEPLVTQPRGRAKTPQLTHAHTQDKPSTQRQTAKVGGKATTVQAAKQRLPASKAAKNAKAGSSLSVRAAPAALSAKPHQPADVFDLPSSDDESHVPTPKPIRRAPIATHKEPAKSLKARDARPGTESEDSEALKKRKRRGSVSSTLAPKPAIEQNEDDSLPQRSHKYPRKKGDDSPGHEHTQPPSTSAQPDPQSVAPAVNKPRRTRLRTVPVQSRPAMANGQSSPATLHGTLPNNRTSKASPITEAPETTTVEDDTMYEIPDVMTKPLRRRPDPSSGSVTPRQKALFGSLLGTASSSATPMPSMSKLQLTDRKPSSILGALSRSKSDLTHSTQSRKAKLIASLKQPESSSDEAGSGSEVDSSGEEEIQSTTAITKSGQGHATKVTRATSVESDMEVDNEVAADSQTSQATSTFGSRSKFTYAKSRSYLQEANPEDAFLMSMDLDEPITFGSQNKNSQAEEEEEASQVRPNHELKRQGHNTKFHWDNQMLIDDIATRSNNSIRRSTMLELCTQMADETFAHDLLDSSLADDFFENASSTGDVIFDFAVAVATLFLLGGKPDYTVLDLIYRSEIPSSLHKLLDYDTDIIKIAKNRKSNLSRLAQESVATFRSTILSSSIWPSAALQTVSPRIVALKGLESLVLGLRHTANAESIISKETAEKLVDLAAGVAEGAQRQGGSEDLTLILETTFSILEAESLAKQKPIVWSAHMLQRLAKAMPMAFQTGQAAMITTAVKLCMNLTNNKPKACQQFSDRSFVHTLVQSIVVRAKLLQADVEEAQRAEALDTLILSLGAMINLTEHSNQARINVDDGGQLIEDLVATFVNGSVRTAQVSLSPFAKQGSGIDTNQAASMEQSQSSVVVGYLSVLLGNVCLNEATKAKIRAHLPDRNLATLVEKIKEFLHVHEQVNRKAKQFEGAEGQETWQNYTARIMQVVEHLEESGI